MLSGYPIASMPLGYVENTGRPFGMAAIASAHKEATLIKVQSAWDRTIGRFHPPPYDVFNPGRVESIYHLKRR